MGPCLKRATLSAVLVATMSIAAGWWLVGQFTNARAAAYSGYSTGYAMGNLNNVR